jgi:uncharacterized protein
VAAKWTTGDSFDLGQLGLSAGEGRWLDLEVRPGSFSFGGQRYEPVPGRVPARLDVSRTATGFALRLRFEARVRGPCVRCLGDAEVLVRVDAREVDQPATQAEELSSPYVSGSDELDLAGWSHDSLVLAMPERFLCRPECAGLCPVCGVSLNDVDPATHRHEREPDPRFAKLEELRERLK